MIPNTNQISEYGLLSWYFDENEMQGFPFGENVIIWPQEFNVEVDNYFKKCLDWWIEVKEEDQSYSMYTVFEVTEFQAREFIRAAHEQKWGIGSRCYAMVAGKFSCGQD